MRITHFDVYKDLLKDRSGLNLTPENAYMIESRLGPVAKRWGYLSLEALTMALQGVPDKKLVNDVVEAMTSNDTSFFRDNAPFTALRELALPVLLKAREKQKKLRVLCAGCASGQEAYSIAIAVKESLKNLPPAWKAEIAAVDISETMLTHAHTAVYSQMEVQRGLPLRTLLKHFKQIEPGKWKVNDDIRKLVRFEHVNLLDPLKDLGRFDIVFCRNIIGDFDEKLQKDTLKKLSGLMEKDGFLFLGLQEQAGTVFEPHGKAPGLFHLAPKAVSA